MCWPGPAPARLPARVRRGVAGGCTAATRGSWLIPRAGGQEVLIHLRARRFFCGNVACAKATFAEQVPGLTVRYGRRTAAWRAYCRRSRWRWVARAGARLSGRLALRGEPLDADPADPRRSPTR